MKGVVFGATFFILIFVVFLSLSSYTYFDHNRQVMNEAFKKSLIETAKNYESANYNIDNVLDYFLADISSSLPDDFTYDFKLLGFSEDPLLIRIELAAVSKKSAYTFIMEETIIQKEVISR